MYIVGRNEWKARAPVKAVRVAPSARRLFIVHYSAGPASQSVRAIQDWCMNDPPHGRGFSDVDYNFLVRGTTGEVYEGRGWDIIGSHTKGYNTEGIGVCVISDGPISPAGRDSVRELYGAAVHRSGHLLTVKGHRDLDATTCPGAEIYSWLHTGGVTAHRGPRVLQVTTPWMTGADIQPIQVKVGVTADGVYGPATERAVKLWQAKHALTPDGIVGPATRVKMGFSA